MSVPFFDLLPLFTSSWKSAPCVELLHQIDQASRHHGCFYARQEALLGANLIAECLHEAQDYFAQPLDAKRKDCGTRQSRYMGFRPMGVDASLDTCEQYKLGYTREHDGDRISTLAHGLANRHIFRWATLKFWENSWTLGKRIQAAFAYNLGLRADYFDQFTDRPMHQLGLSYYPLPSTETGAPAYASQAHRDMCMFALVAQDRDGLEACFLDGTWAPLTAPAADAVLVLVGDYLERWSGGAYLAPSHRVRRSEHRERHSVTLTYRPNFEAVVIAPRQLQSPHRPEYSIPFHAGREQEHTLDRIVAGPPA
jgi:isopenicillin N synthase-like dioxygenase